jgi:hypothetical protein
MPGKSRFSVIASRQHQSHIQLNQFICPTMLDTMASILVGLPISLDLIPLVAATSSMLNVGYWLLASKGNCRASISQVHVITRQTYFIQLWLIAGLAWSRYQLLESNNKDRSYTILGSTILRRRLLILSHHFVASRGMQGCST